ncbi:hypothetical protein DAEQUDRAFT_760550 [Daedalea quercina L-15889]|uniref:Uncharacterized protein n=1 Tax=Daedalea quercina L-15889 TaxID=1314783 RepID=A0A165KLG7_9APHY|nr:hypothetical protein DAEQUDRAFT_760550 [Daedalea quercina L-15889]
MWSVGWSSGCGHHATGAGPPALTPKRSSAMMILRHTPQIQLPPSYSSPGGQLSLIINGQHALFGIKKAFLPFTKSVAVLAQPASELTGSNAAEYTASLVVVKIFDPRVLDDRTATETKRPWSLAAEQCALQDRARKDFSRTTRYSTRMIPNLTTSNGWQSVQHTGNKISFT